MTWIFMSSQPKGKDCPKAAKELMAGGTPKKERKGKKARELPEEERRGKEI